MLLREVADSPRCILNGNVEAIEALEKTVTAKRMGCECVYHLLNLIGDDVTAGKVRGLSKTVRKMTLGQEVLNQHLLNCRFGEVRIN